MSEDHKPYHVTAKKSLGQHFLTSDIVPRWMCDAANLEPGGVVLEVGPGTGVLTAELLARGVEVIAIETDRRSIEVLEERFAKAIDTGQLHIYDRDIRNGLPTDSRLQPHLYTVVANIPYYLTGYLFRTFLETEHQPHTLVFLVQKELATRIARDKKGSLLSLSVQAFGTPKYVRTVSPGHFAPPPRVQSAILAVTAIGHERIALQHTSHFFQILHAGFAHKRKFLASNLANVWDKSVVEEAFLTLNITPKIRAEDVSLSTWIELTKILPPI